jgi:hypothetical protein
MEDTIKAMLPKEKDLSEGPLRVQCENRDSYTGYNTCLSEVHALVPAIIEKVYEELRGKIGTVRDIYSDPLYDKWDAGGVQACRHILSLLSTKK